MSNVKEVGPMDESISFKSLNVSLVEAPGDHCF